MPSYLFRNNYELQVCISMNKEIMESSFMYFFFHEALHWYKYSWPLEPAHCYSVVKHISLEIILLILSDRPFYITQDGVVRVYL